MTDITLWQPPEPSLNICARKLVRINLDRLRRQNKMPENLSKNWLFFYFTQIWLIFLANYSKFEIVSSTMSFRLNAPPMKKPVSAMARMMKSLIHIHQGIPFKRLWAIMSSDKAGKTKQRTTQQTLPMRLKSSPRFGTSWAIVKTIIKRRIRKAISQQIGCFSESFHESVTFGYIIWTGTKNWMAKPSMTPTAIISMMTWARLEVKICVFCHSLFEVKL